MSANDGGDPVRVSRKPINRPAIPRGRTLIPKVRFDQPVAIGSRVTFDWRRGGFDLTFHAIKVIGETDADLIADVRPDDVVTWA